VLVVRTATRHQSDWITSIDNVSKLVHTTECFSFGSFSHTLVSSTAQREAPYSLPRLHRFSQPSGIVSPGIRRMQMTAAKHTNANIITKSAEKTASTETPAQQANIRSK